MGLPHSLPINVVNHGKPNNINNINIYIYNNNTSPKYLKVMTLMVGKPPQMPPGLPITSSPMPHAPPRPQACRQTSAPPRRPLTQSSAPAPDSDVGIIWRLRMTTGRLNRTEPGASDGGTMGYHQATGWHWHVPNFETRKVQRMVQHANTLRKWMKAGQIQDERQLAIVVFILLHDM